MKQLENQLHYYTYRGVIYDNMKSVCEALGIKTNQFVQMRKRGAITKTQIGYEKEEKI